MSNLLYAADTFTGEENVNFHTHGGAEAILIDAGHCRIDVGELSFDCPAKTLLLVPSELSHNQINHEPTATTYVIFEDHLLGEPVLLDLICEPYLQAWMHELTTLSKRFEMDQAGCLLAAMTMRLGQLRRGERPALPPALQKAENFILQHYTQPIGSTEAARAAQVSASLLKNLYRQHLQTTPSRRIADCRMRQARQLLMSPYGNINEIAQACGFADPAYFIRRFKQLHGLTPGDYRLAGK